MLLQTLSKLLPSFGPTLFEVHAYYILCMIIVLSVYDLHVYTIY